MESTSELGRQAYLGINLVLLLAAIVLQRRAFLAFGGTGVGLYLGELAHRLFKDSILFPLVLRALGLGIMGLGWAYRRHCAALDAAVMRRLPDWLCRSLPRNRAM
ncbi:MAG: hypothetical protein Q8O35_13050 [Humidesulfovibrio sp.]|jgi:hypothetical protein|uniref:hypothetical protein n=1 Tax=Humidesulfovibrio sp. TaxID=2910988 RepID=UPI002732EA83|nr:hypothetical protein [Humidesulfovibrio sp.]MDP2849099.1 hypothetical protein [Humidesulfovibrio sp.]